MTMNRVFSVAAAIALATFVGCDAGGEEDVIDTTETEIITEPATEQVEVTVPTTDTLMVERTTDVDVEVDTTRIEGEVEEPVVR